MDFVIGGVAGMMATAITNPFDVVRTRMQLQGETRTERLYKNIPHALYTIAKNDGIMALQRGIVPSLMFQLIGSSISMVPDSACMSRSIGPVFLRDSNSITIFSRSLVTAAVAGATGAGVGSPLLLVKTQLQSASSGDIKIGTQHSHRGTVSALLNICRRNGLPALWNGARGQMMRNAVGSSAQIATFAVCKDVLEASPKYQEGSKYWASFIASNVGAVAKTIAMNPLDVMVTRLYNQPLDERGKGKLYSGVMDCAQKMYINEGLLSFYRGVGPSYMRQGPQSVLVLMFWDLLKDLQKRYRPVKKSI